ncbi:MAG TPA: hypothetical protein VK427_24800, partial [Kofleriaceae bacterium]|nr:hypothetical protein [Kofleriaceae bacterium]
PAAAHSERTSVVTPVAPRDAPVAIEAPRPSTPSPVVTPPRETRETPRDHVAPAEPTRVAPTGPSPKLDAIMGEANRAYDHGEFDEAKQIALKVLERAPGNVRMLRVVVSAECIAGDASEAQRYFAQLPVDDRVQMRTRCDRYGVTLKDP